MDSALRKTEEMPTGTAGEMPVKKIYTTKKLTAIIRGSSRKIPERR